MMRDRQGLGKSSTRSSGHFEALDAYSRATGRLLQGGWTE